LFNYTVLLHKKGLLQKKKKGEARNLLYHQQFLTNNGRDILSMFFT